MHPCQHNKSNKDPAAIHAQQTVRRERKHRGGRARVFVSFETQPHTKKKQNNKRKLSRYIRWARGRAECEGGLREEQALG